MHENDLRQLQRLGIDIWVSPQRARELIAAGQANSLVDVEGTQTSKTASSRRRTERNWGSRTSTESTSPSRKGNSDVPNRRSEQNRVSEWREGVEEKATLTRFDVKLRVYLYGSVAMLIEHSAPCPDLLIRDILVALSGFEDHQLNELHFKFPVVDLSKNESSIPTLAGAQEGFQAWFEQRAPHCESLLLIGSPASDTAARLKKKIVRTISINELPLTRAGKQQLWNQIKNLSV
ncbi:MAG: hypothetical protein OXG15_07920 [Gammaproteobacteria bacterium]|nr:hypothetical protein [Gammaproteobacteria bacterium]